ncbi:SUMO-specific isopeptidase USPL1 isoform X2 [Oncorhynchus mykiss]|uniref:SUMO-specific isopeptidase USPL1 isoform X2 n=1 Tax=Oncorhynchus mykiss TaxID=8022 RepID=UPI0018782979|nr:SUMO-specific isopeptidase USPL1 isoform X2 [Oncorhynchus mykiss]
MSGDGTGLGAPGPLAGYWEKIQERSALLETCPWCAAKGQSLALRSYRINSQEFITLCTDPQCLFPLVSRPLEDVLASLVPPLHQTQTGSKRKRPCGLENGDPVPSPKHARSVESEVAEDAVSQSGALSVSGITSKLNGEEECFNGKKERIRQSEHTNMDVVNKTLKHTLPETERGGANAYHKDSGWSMPEEMDQELLEEEQDGVCRPEDGTPTLDKGFPLQKKTATCKTGNVSAVESTVESEGAQKEVLSTLQEAVFARENTFSAPQVAISLPEKISRPLHVAVSASTSAPEKPLAKAALVEVVPTFEDTVSLLEALTAPGEVTQSRQKVHPPLQRTVKVVSAPEKVVSAPEKVVSAPEKVVSAPEKVVSAPEKLVSAPEKVVSAPEKVVSAPEKVVSAPEKVVSAPEKVVSAPEKVVSAPEKVVSAPEKVVSAPEKVVSAPEKVVSAPEKVVSAPEKVAMVPPAMEAVLVLQDALTVLENASPGIKEGLAVLKKDEEEECLIEEKDVAILVALDDVPASEEVEKALPALVEDVPASEEVENSLPALVEAVPALEKDEEEVATPALMDNECGEDDLSVFDEEECSPEVMCRPCSVDLSQSKVPVEVHDDDDGPIKARRRAQNTRQLISSEDEMTGETMETEREGSVTEEVEVVPSPPKKKMGRPRKTSIIKYTQVVVPNFDPEVISTEELVPVPGPHLFWRNEHSLCWLDTLLVALVHLHTLRDRRPTKRPTVGQPVWDLCESYNRACGLITAYQHTGADGVVRVPSAVLQRVQTEMQAIRMSIFRLLEPLLKCKLGQNETPVFALPLLLRADSWAEPLFQQAYEWQFECISTTCQHATNTKCKKTLTTFTKVLSDWHPLNAAHQSRCSKCNKRKQTRMLVLERVSPVFVLHFVEGLPDNDLCVYSFTFQQQEYSVTTVIQYDQQLKHFVTWIRRTDGSWLEFDDLKHPNCVSHTQLVVPPREIHVVFWELKTDRPDNPQTSCSPPVSLTSTLLIHKELQQPPLAKLFVNNESQDISQTVSDDADTDMDSTITAGYIDNDMDATLTNNVNSPIAIGSTSVLHGVPVQSCYHNLSLPLHNDTAVVEALTVSDDTDIMDATVTTGKAGNSSISTTLLDTFEGLSRDDVVTLTLVEVKVGSDGRPLDDNNVSLAPGQNGDLSPPLPAPTPEAENPAPAHEMPPETDVVVIKRPSSPDTASVFLLASSDGPSEPDSEKPTPPSPPRLRRGRSTSNKAKMMASNTPVAPAAKVVATTPPRTATPMALPGKCGGIILPSVVSMMSLSNVEPSTPAPEAPTPPSPPPHSKPTTTSTSLQSKPGLPPPPDPNSRWSYLLSLHPTSIPNPPRPTSHFKHSTPNRFQQLSHSWQTPSMAPPNPDARLKKPPPPPLPKPKLSKVDNEALPVKAAEMYGGFQARSRIVNINMNSPSKTSSPTQLLSQITDPQNGAWKIPSQPPALVSRKPLINHTTSAVPIVTSLPPSPGVTEIPKISSSRKHSPGGQVSETDALRYKLLKKLKAKKKKLEKLNQMLGYQGGAGGRGEVTCTPDITDRSPSHTVSSSTSVYDSPAYDQFFADLLSPATTASNLSPDSTGLLEMLTTNGQEGGGDLACGGNGISGASQVVTPVILHPANHGVVVPQPGLAEPITASGENFLEEFISGSANQQTEMETDTLSALDLFF